MVFNKKGDSSSNPLWNNIFYLIIIVVVAGVFLGFVSNQKEAAGMWEDFYSKEISRVINSAVAGSEVSIDVTKAISVAERRGKNFGEIFYFDNEKKEVFVSLRNNGGKRYSFFNDVAIADWNVELSSGGADKSRLHFKVIESRKEIEK